MGYNRPLPTPRGEEHIVFDGAREHKLVYQRCRACGNVPIYPRTVCPECMSEDLDVLDSTGRGVVYAFATHYRPGHPSFADAVPYTLALVEFAEGHRLIGDLVDCPPDAVRVGMPVEVVFDDVTDGFTLPRFRLAGTTAADGAGADANAGRLE